MNKVAQHPIGMAALQKLTNVNIILKGEPTLRAECIITYKPEAKSLTFEYTSIPSLGVKISYICFYLIFS